MPQSSAALSRRWESDEKATAFLEQEGFVLNPTWEWTPPERPMTAEEWSAVFFMIDEWDFGGVVVRAVTCQQFPCHCLGQETITGACVPLYDISWAERSAS